MTLLCNASMECLQNMIKNNHLKSLFQLFDKTISY